MYWEYVELELFMLKTLIVFSVASG
jgi:hypothetical protein